MDKGKILMPFFFLLCMLALRHKLIDITISYFCSKVANPDTPLLQASIKFFHFNQLRISSATHIFGRTGSLDTIRSCSLRLCLFELGKYEGIDMSLTKQNKNQPQRLLLAKNSAPELEHCCVYWPFCNTVSIEELVNRELIQEAVKFFCTAAHPKMIC